tara:strand:+ start:167779 stop:168537 length:759 start_codon:yes stop_codon:yes gene_type:complete
MDVTAPNAAPKVNRADAPNAILPLRVEDLLYEANGQRLIDNISFSLNAGPRTVILGPNGAGKSLLLRLCHGLIQPSAGTVTWRGANAAKHQAMVFQRPVLLRRSVLANVLYGLKLKGTPRAARAGIADDVLARTGLARFQDTPARLLSGGEQQKLALARAWALRPQVLFLDEPTSNLDPAATHAVESICQHMHDEGTRLIMTTHDLGQAKRIADEVLFIHKGRLLEHTPAAHFFETPASGEAAAFLRGDLRW